MPTGGNLEVSAKEAKRGILGGPLSPTTTQEDLGLFQSGEGADCAKKAKPTDGDAATAVRYFILFPPRALRIILHNNRVDPL